MGALKEAVEEKEVRVREEKMEKLAERSDCRRAHPTVEHLLPLHVAVGAAGEDKGVELFEMLEGGMAWGLYRFGDVGNSSVGEEVR